MTVQELIEELTKYPPMATVHAYEGEEIGITIIDNNEYVGFIPTPGE